MRKFICLLMLLVSLGASAQYMSMKYDIKEGEPVYSGLSNLEIVFKDGNMIATWDSNSMTIPLEDLNSMQFSTSPASIEKLLADDVKIEVYNLDGNACGSYANMKEASKFLSAGIYVARTENGVTSKFVVK